MQIIKIRNENEDIITNSVEIKIIIREYSGQLYVNKLDNLDEMDKSLETQNQSRPNHKEIENLTLTSYKK